VEPVDSEKRKALTDFYREEFVRYLQQLESAGILNDGNHKLMQKTCQKLVFELDRVCLRDEFPAVAETLLQNFDTLTRLSEIETRVAH
jgi:hypothetical protein